MNNTTQKLYNFIALLCSEVINSCPEDFFVNYSCISLDEKAELYSKIKNQVPALERQLSDQDFDDAFFNMLDDVVHSFAMPDGQKDFYGIIALIQLLDDGLHTILISQIKDFQEDDFVVVLNSNRETTGIGLLPRCSCAWERKHRLSHSYNRLDNFLFNFLLLENKILGELIDKHFFLKKDLFIDFETKRYLTIAATPLTQQREFGVATSINERIQVFDITYEKKDYTQDNELIWKKIELSAHNKSDIILFPEMLGTPTLEEYISTKLKGLSESERANYPSMIILPSFWNKGKNSVSILDRHGNVLCRQLKQNPFRIEANGQGYLENIKSSNVVNIFHFEGIGRIAILICKDFLTTKYMEQLMRCFKLTLIIVPSFSTGSYDFLRSFDLCAHDDCNVIWINTCAAMEKGKESNFENIGYIRKRISRTDDEAQMLCKMPACQNAFVHKCQKDCIFIEKINAI